MNRMRGFWWVLGLSVLVARCGSKAELVGSNPGSGGAGGRDGGFSGGVNTGGLDFGEGGPCMNGSCGGDGGDGSVDSGPGPFCGDGALNQTSEACDDGNIDSGDGCSAACVVEANHVCPNPGEPCVNTVTCGDGKVGGDEQCDDKNTRANDGCDDKCALEPGYACPFPGVRCVAAECGDSLVAGVEECDDGNATPSDGCSTTCRLEDGFKCVTPGEKCTATTCRDGVTEGTEQCDDKNFDLGDGCSPFCKLEPNCTNGACVSACGDGIILGGEACDDGNKRDGDGCAADCTVELGFKCTLPPLAPDLTIPLVIRDAIAVDPNPAYKTGAPQDYVAANHVDFETVDATTNERSGTEDGEGSNARIVRVGAGASASGRGLDLGQPGETWDLRNTDGSLVATLSLAGKPVYRQTRAQCDRTALPDLANDWLKCTRTTMDGDSFHTWYTDRDSAGNAIAWPNFLAKNPTVLKTLTLLRGSFNETSAAFTAGGEGYTYDSRYMRLDGTIPPNTLDDPTSTATPKAKLNPLIRTPGFFPVDELGLTGTACGTNDRHNFHFTSEVRFWFEYDSTTAPRLDFSGDDDVWVYVNGHLALDIGGIHGRAAKSFTITPANATAWGLADGKVYEIAVFQAERNQCLSNYWLTLKGFNTSKSECTSICGDGIVASDELCDDGDDNQATNPPDYGKCGPDCRTRGPNCGDGTRQADHEECDDGVNASVYDFGGVGCAPGCKKPPRCGDGILQGANEECDDGTNDGAYGGCTASCKLAPRCGDSRVQRSEGEQCDDGPRGSSACTSTCRSTSPR